MGVEAGREAMSATRRLIAVVLLVPTLAAVALWAFAWPAARAAPRDLPLGVAGPAVATAQVEKELARHEGAFEIHRYRDEAAARAAVEDRTVYGAVVVAAQGPELLTASAASPVVAQLLQQAVARQAAAGGTQVTTVDVVPAPSTDPRGAALNASVLSLALAGTAVPVGLVAAAVADSWLGVLSGDWWAEASVFGLSTLAVAAAVAGCAALVGPAGIGAVSFLGDVPREPVLRGGLGPADAARAGRDDRPVAAAGRGHHPAALGVVLRRRGGGRPRPHPGGMGRLRSRRGGAGCPAEGAEGPGRTGRRAAGT